MMNVSILMGRLTATPELKTTENGTSVTSFSLAVDRRYQPKGGEKITDFINCVAWRNAAEFITRYFKKGDMIAVKGEIQMRKYTDKNSNNRVAFEVVIDQAEFCGGKNNDNNADNNADFAPYPSGNFEEIADNDDLPF